MNYPEALAYIQSFTDYERKLPEGKLPTDYFLARQAALLHDLGDPQRAFPAVVVAGTKGKGSTCAMLESVLRTAGYRVGLWTSPHLHTYRERIQVDRHLIDPEQFADLVNLLPSVIAAFDAASHGGLPTTFELGFAIALLYFAQQKVDIAVLEVGLGGRYDSANVVTPLVSVISSISYDHMEILGDTLAKIAYDKAGIIKPGVPVVTVPQPEAAARVFADVAAAVGVPLYISQQSAVGSRQSPDSGQQSVVGSRQSSDSGQQSVVGSRQSPCHLVTLSPDYPESLTLPRLALRGPFQRQNAALAASAALLLREGGFVISDAAIAAGVASAQWPGRLEVAGQQPLVVVDGAHNGDSAVRLAEALGAEFSFGRLILVLGVLRDKDFAAIAAGIVPLADEVILIVPTSPRALDHLDLLAAAAHPFVRGPLHYAQSVDDALALARSRAAADDLICVTGSLATVADARVALGLVTEHD